VLLAISGSVQAEAVTNRGQRRPCDGGGADTALPTEAEANRRRAAGVPTNEQLWTS
jgi:hypothetical protein